MKIERSVVDAIRRHAAVVYPDECCGVLLGSSAESLMATEAIQVANSSEENKARRYTIDAQTLLRITRDAARRELDVVGFYHSHPDHPARPSKTDLQEATFPHYVYLILAVDRGEPRQLTAWSLAEDRSAFLPREIEIIQQTSRVIESS